jgi:hypothetical protein
MDEGFVYHITFPVKKPGAFQFRIAIRDEQGGSIGSASQFIQVPNLKKKDLTLSSLVLEGMTVDQWKKIADASSSVSFESSSLRDTALRQAKSGTILRYGCEIYNARPSASGKPDLTGRIRLIGDGKILLDGKPQPVTTSTDGKRPAFSGAVSLGTQLVPGDYILQMIVTDNAAPEKKKLASQYIQFEVVQ